MSKKIDRELKKYAKEYINALAKAVDSYTPEEETLPEKQTLQNIRFKCRKKVVILVCIVIVAISLTACWKPISKFVYEIYNKYISIIFVPNNTDDNTKYIKIDDVQLGYVPNNYELQVDWKTEKSIIYGYYNKANNSDLSILIEKLDDGIEKGVDIENADFIADPNSFVANKNGYVVLCIFKENVSVEITGKISTDEAVKIAKNIKFFSEEK